MKKICFIIACFISTHAFAQDSTKSKPKEWLGVLTLTDKFRTETNWTPQDQATVGEHFQRLVKMKEAGIVALAG